MVNKYLVRNSKIHGKGIFAKRKINVGEKIIQYKGKKITKKESERISKKLQEKTNINKSLGEIYIFDLNKRYDLDGNIPNNPAKYINHSCNPNSESEQDEKNKIWITAIREIISGEEITYNYGFNSVDYKKNPCKCQAPNCKGYILAEKHWNKIKTI
jgi:uncharacterized protein